MTNQFPLGRVYVSVGATAALSPRELSTMLTRHMAGERRVSGTGSQVVSEFTERSSRGQSLNVWVVTEANGIRTLVMLPRETPYRTDDMDYDRTDGVTAVELPELWPFVPQIDPPRRTAALKAPQPSPKAPPPQPISPRASGKGSAR